MSEKYKLGIATTNQTIFGVLSYAQAGGMGFYEYTCFLCKNSFDSEEVNYSKAIVNHWRGACNKCEDFAGYRKGGRLYKERLRIQQEYTKNGMKP